MNRQQRRAQARQKGQGMSYADQLAKRQIGRQTLRMAMEDEAVALAADIKCQHETEIEAWKQMITGKEGP